MEKYSHELKIGATKTHIEVSAILDRWSNSRSILVLGHGSGSTMHVPFIVGLSNALLEAGVATLRYEFPFSDREDFIPYSDMEMDPEEILVGTARSAIALAEREAPDLPLFAGGHSVSGRVTSETDSASPLPNLRGLVLLGFPLKGDMERAAHFDDANHPLLFIQGTDDPYADVNQITHVVGSIRSGATVHFIKAAGHGFDVPGRPDESVHTEIAETIADWIARQF